MRVARKLASAHPQLIRDSRTKLLNTHVTVFSQPLSSNCQPPSQPLLVRAVSTPCPQAQLLTFKNLQ